MDECFDMDEDFDTEEDFSGVQFEFKIVCEICQLYKLFCNCDKEDLPLEEERTLVPDHTGQGSEVQVQKDGISCQHQSYPNLIPPTAFRQPQGIIPPPLIPQDENPSPQPITTRIASQHTPSVQETEEEESINAKVGLWSNLRSGNKKMKKKFCLKNHILDENLTGATSLMRTYGDIKKINLVIGKVRRIGKYRKKDREIIHEENGNIVEIFNEANDHRRSRNNRFKGFFDDKTFGYRIGELPQFPRTTLAINKFYVLIEYEDKDGKICKVVFSYLFKKDTKNMDFKEKKPWYDLKIEEEGSQIFPDEFTRKTNAIDIHRQQQRQRQTNNVMNQNLNIPSHVLHEEGNGLPSLDYLYHFFWNQMQSRGIQIDSGLVTYDDLCEFYRVGSYDQKLRYKQQPYSPPANQVMNSQNSRMMKSKKANRRFPFLHKSDVPEEADRALNPTQQLGTNMRPTPTTKTKKRKRNDHKEEEKNVYSPARKKRRVE